MTNTELREQIIQELQSTLVEDWMSAKVRAESCAKFAETIQSTMSDEVLDKLRAVLVKHGAQETELPAAVAQTKWLQVARFASASGRIYSASSARSWDGTTETIEFPLASPLPDAVASTRRPQPGI